MRYSRIFPQALNEQMKLLLHLLKPEIFWHKLWRFSVCLNDILLVLRWLSGLGDFQMLKKIAPVIAPALLVAALAGCSQDSSSGFIDENAEPGQLVDREGPEGPRGPIGSSSGG